MVRFGLEMIITILVLFASGLAEEEEGNVSWIPGNSNDIKLNEFVNFMWNEFTLALPR